LLSEHIEAPENGARQSLCVWHSGFVVVVVCGTVVDDVEALIARSVVVAVNVVDGAATAFPVSGWSDILEIETVIA